MMGSEFATGFMFGAKFGSYDEKDLYNCLKNEPNADQVFLVADQKLKEAVKNNDLEKYQDGLVELVHFIF